MTRVRTRAGLAATVSVALVLSSRTGPADAQTPTPVPTPNMDQELPAMHFHGGDSQAAFDYVHSGPFVPPSVTFMLGEDEAHDGHWLASPVGVTDWNGQFIEAGWITVSALSTFAADFPECMYPLACAYHNSGNDGLLAFNINRTGRFSAGTRPFFKVEVAGTGTEGNTWKTSWARGGGWNEMEWERTFGTDEMDWIVAGIEGARQGGVVMLDAARIDYNMYSNTSFGNSWVWANNCGQSEIQPWCYTHIITSDVGCAICGPTLDPGQEHQPFTGPCTDRGNCTKSWDIKL